MLKSSSSMIRIFFIFLRTLRKNYNLSIRFIFQKKIVGDLKQHYQVVYVQIPRIRNDKKIYFFQYFYDK